MIYFWMLVVGFSLALAITIFEVLKEKDPGKRIAIFKEYSNLQIYFVSWIVMTGLTCVSLIGMVTVSEYIANESNLEDIRNQFPWVSQLIVFSLASTMIALWILWAAKFPKYLWKFTEIEKSFIDSRSKKSKDRVRSWLKAHGLGILVKDGK